MKLLLWATAFLFSVSGLEDDEWNRYKEAHKKVYTTREEDVRRLQQYLKSKQMVEEHNRRYRRGETSYTMAINRFSDWFPEEMRTQGDFKLDRSKFRGKEFELPAGTPIPKSINWVKKGAVTKVKDEGKCHASYAFSAAGAMEALMFIQNKTLTDLSAQQLLDCAVHDCDAGTTESALRVVEKMGIATDQSYPYAAKKRPCNVWESPVAFSTGFGVVEDERNLKKVVGTQGPAAVHLTVGPEFLSYKGGIFHGPCGDTEYSMLVVGYGKDKKTKQDYWLLKGSWGRDWGEKGYMRLLRNVNVCYVAASGRFPLYCHIPQR